jgi:hypothetical protein
MPLDTTSGDSIQDIVLFIMKHQKENTNIAISNEDVNSAPEFFPGDLTNINDTSVDDETYITILCKLYACDALQKTQADDECSICLNTKNYFSPLTVNCTCKNAKICLDCIKQIVAKKPLGAQQPCPICQQKATKQQTVATNSVRSMRFWLNFTCTEIRPLIFYVETEFNIESATIYNTQFKNIKIVIYKKDHIKYSQTGGNNHRAPPRMKKTEMRITFKNVNRIVYLGPRGGKYVCIKGRYLSLCKLTESGHKNRCN